MFFFFFFLYCHFLFNRVAHFIVSAAPYSTGPKLVLLQSPTQVCLRFNRKFQIPPRWLLLSSPRR